jgi:hypothetical protein
VVNARSDLWKYSPAVLSRLRVTRNAHANLGSFPARDFPGLWKGKSSLLDRSSLLASLLAGDIFHAVAPLPPEIRNVILAIERKYREIKPEDWDDPDLERFKLTVAEKKGLQFVGPYYASNPLPPSEP